MTEIQLEKRPFFINSDTGVTITKGFQSLKKASQHSSSLPIVVKQYNCTRVALEDAMEVLNQHINEGLAQARVDHPHACKLLQMRVHIAEDLSISISHVLEALDKDVSQVIKERKKANHPYTEGELRTFLIQVAEALAHAHSKGIAHCDVKPENVFQTSSGEYKVGDFGSFWEKKYMKRSDLQTQTDSGIGTPVFMSPQMKQSCQGLKVEYRPFKNDVFSLGASALNLAALEPPFFLKEEQCLDEVVSQQVRRLPLSSELATLLRDMLSTQEHCRPTMQDVLLRLTSPPPSVVQAALPAPTRNARIDSPEKSKVSKLVPAEQLSKPVPPQQFSAQKLILITQTHLQLFSIQSNNWEAATNFNRPIKFDGGSTYACVDETRICVCGNISKVTGSGGETYVVHVGGTVQELPSMMERRWGAGLIVDNGNVLAFGGNSWAGNDDNAFYAYGDVYDLGEIYENCITLKLATPLPWRAQQGQMSEGKMGFTPCINSTKVYLCGRKAIDVFNLPTSLFEAPLRVTIQNDFFHDRVVFIAQNKLVMISRERTTRVSLSALNTQEEQHEETVIAPQSSVVMVEGFVYWVRGRKCVRATLQQPTRFQER